jgi:hypothetical protein
MYDFAEVNSDTKAQTPIFEVLQSHLRKTRLSRKRKADSVNSTSKFKNDPIAGCFDQYPRVESRQIAEHAKTSTHEFQGSSFVLEHHRRVADRVGK